MVTYLYESEITPDCKITYEWWWHEVCSRYMLQYCIARSMDAEYAVNALQIDLDALVI